MEEERIKIRVIGIKQETMDVKTFTFEPADGNKIEFHPGQFVFLYAIIGDEEIKRAYSISSSPLDDYIELTIKLVEKGKMTSYFHNSVKKGDIFEISRPAGKFFYTEDLPSIVLIAGGCGIASMRSIIRYCTAKKLKTKITLFYSCRTQEDIIFKKELEELMKKNKNLKIVYNFTRQESITCDGYLGRISAEEVIGHFDDPGKNTYFLCGSNEMVRSLNNGLKEAGIHFKNLKIDLWGN